MTKELTRKKMALTRLRSITEDRQGVNRWLAAYCPAIMAVVGEAPTKSHAFVVPSAKVGRDIHALSRSEQTMAVLALYSDRVWDLHEQRHLSLAPAVHPLSDHRIWGAYTWPSSSGTVKLAEKLGLASKHPMFICEIDGKPMRVPFPWVGDFLLFLEDEHGAYVVAWDCKAEPGKHGKPGPGPFGRMNSKHAQIKAETRELVYQEYMSELEIPIRQVTGSSIDRAVRSNLLRLAHRHTTPVQLPQSLLHDLTCAFGEAFAQGTPPHEVTTRLTNTQTQRLEAIRLLDHLIWNRLLRVDLFSAILPDRPLVPESKDVLKQYDHLFAR